MEQYFGICMVIIVVTICVGLLSKFMTQNIFKQMEAHKKRVSDIRWSGIIKFIITIREKYGKEMDKMFDDFKLKNTKDSFKKIDELIEEAKDKGVDINNI
jgi:hypothetical protein